LRLLPTSICTPALALLLTGGACAQGTVYVSSEKDDALTMIDVATLAVKGTIATCKRGRHLQLTPDRKLMLACSDSGVADVIDPATERKIASVASASVDDAKAAIDAADAAFEGWAGRKPRERAEILRKAYELIMRDAERFAKLITLENGKALTDSRGEVAYAAEFFRWYAEEAVRNIGQISTAPALRR